MTQPKVAVRLGTEGKAEAQRDFREYADAGDAAANRVARAFDRASQDMESAQRRQAAAADKLAAIMPQTATQARINMSVGTGASLDEGSARISAQNFRELIAEQERYEQGAMRVRLSLDPMFAAQQRVNAELSQAEMLYQKGFLTAELYEREQARLTASLYETAAALEQVERHQREANQAKVATLLGVGAAPATSNGAGYEALNAEMERQAQIAARIRAELDPLWAAQQRYNTALAEARAAHAAGALSADVLIQKEAQLKEALNAVTLAHTGGNVSVGQYRAGMQQLGFQVQDLGVQFAMAAGSGNVMKGVMTALAMQGPQVVSAIALMRGSAGGFIGFLAGPWGAAIMAATSVLAILGSEFLGSGDDAKKAAAQVDVYTSALQRLAGAQGRVTANDLGMGKVRVEQLRGEIATLDAQIAASNGTRAAVQRRRELEQQRTGLAGQLSSAEATVAGSEIAWNNRLKLDVMGETDKANKKAESAAATAARAAQREREREVERLAKEEARNALRVVTENNRWANDQPIGSSAVAAFDKEGDRLKQMREFMAEQRADTAAGTVLLNMEWELRGKSRDEIEKALELRRYQIDIERQMPGLTGEQVAELVNAKNAQLAFNQVVEQHARNWQEVTEFGRGFIDSVLSPDAWSSWGNLGKTILRELQAEMLKLALLNPIKNALFGDGLPTLTSAFGTLFGRSGSALAAPTGTYNAAIGSEYTTAGSIWVGENGPERVEMPRGSKIMTASESRRMTEAAANDRGDTHVHVYADNALVTEQIVSMISQGMDVASVRGASGGAAMSDAQAVGRARRQLGRRW